MRESALESSRSELKNLIPWYVDHHYPKVDDGSYGMSALWWWFGFEVFFFWLAGSCLIFCKIAYFFALSYLLISFCVFHCWFVSCLLLICVVWFGWRLVLCFRFNWFVFGIDVTLTVSTSGMNRFCRFVSMIMAMAICEWLGGLRSLSKARIHGW